MSSNRQSGSRRAERPALPRRYVCFIVLKALLLSASSAECSSTFPYAKLYSLYERGTKIHAPNVHPLFVVASKDKSIKPSSISLAILAKSGTIDLRIDRDGEIRGFPMSAELLKENPPVLSNQPKGTLLIGGGIGLDLPDSLTFSYKQLNDLLNQATAEMKRAAGMMLSFMVPRAKGIILEFSTPKNQIVTIGYHSGAKILHVDADGGIALPIEQGSLAENPTVTFSEKPLKASVDM